MLKQIEKYGASLLALPFMVTIGLFFILPLMLVVVVSFWDYTSYSIVPDFIFTNYEDIFHGCIDNLPELCTAFSTCTPHAGQMSESTCFDAFNRFSVGLVSVMIVVKLPMS